VKKTKNL